MHNQYLLSGEGIPLCNRQCSHKTWCLSFCPKGAGEGGWSTPQILDCCLVASPRGNIVVTQWPSSPPPPMKELSYCGCTPGKIILVPLLFCPYQHCFASQRTDTCPSKLLPFCLVHTKGVTVNSWSSTIWDHDNVSLFHSVSVPNFLTLHFFTSPHTPGINPIRSNSSCQKHVRLVILHNCTVPNCSHKPSWNTWEPNYRFSDIETKLTNHITRAFQ